MHFILTCEKQHRLVDFPNRPFIVPFHTEKQIEEEITDVLDTLVLERLPDVVPRDVSYREEAILNNEPCKVVCQSTKKVIMKSTSSLLASLLIYLGY